MAKISFTLTNGGQTVLVDDTDIIKFQANSSTGSLVYVQNLGAQPQVLDVTADPSTVAGYSALFISLTQVNPVFPTAAVTFTLNGGSPSFIAGEQVFFAGGSAGGQISTTNGSTTMTVTSFSGQTLANGMSVQGVDSGAAGAVSGTPTYTYVSSQAFYLNAARVIEYSATGSEGTTTILVNDGNTPNGSQIQVSETLSAVTTLMAGTGYVTIGGAQTVTGNKTFSGTTTISGASTITGTATVTKAVLVKSNVTQTGSKTSTVVTTATAGTITTVALSDAANASFSFTVTNANAIATSNIQLTVDMNSSTGWANCCVTKGSGSFIITVKNVDASAAFNAAIKIDYLIL